MNTVPLQWPAPDSQYLKVESPAVQVAGLPAKFRELLDRLGWMHYGLFALPLIITSGSDGKHATDSLHYQHRAVDLRTLDIAGPSGDLFAAIIIYFSSMYTAALFDEREVPGGPHFHLEYHGN